MLRFLPALLLFGITAVLNLSPIYAQQSKGVLSYATSVNINDLTARTNAERKSAGVASLSLNSKLNSAAQAKADDMVARNYWSHTTPDGKEPWSFMIQVNYAYIVAGENLAYGFATSADTVTGWMNSQSHRDNLMNSAFLEVGFGIANSSNFVDSGEETIVVAMYGTQPTTPASPSTLVATDTSKPTQTKNEKSKLTQTADAEQIETSLPSSLSDEEASNLSSTDQDSMAVPTRVRRIQTLSGGNATWSAGLVGASLCSVSALWALQHGRRLKRYLIKGEHYLMRHLHLDFTFLALISLGLTLLGTNGFVR